jgi:hypothetical protein
MRIYAFVFLGVSSLATPVARAGDPAYTLVDLGARTAAYAINDRNEIAGMTSDENAAVWSNGVWHEYAFQKTSAVGRAIGIDEQGDLVGAEDPTAHVEDAVWLPKGKSKARQIPVSNKSISEGSRVGVSADGKTVVGTDHDLLCFEWHPGDAETTGLGIPDGFVTCQASDVDSAGDIVGGLSDWGDSSAAFVYRDGMFNLVDVRTDTSTTLSAINEFGHAAGRIDSMGATYWDGTTLSLIPQQGALHMLGSFAIDAADDIVGYGKNGSGYADLLYSGGTLIDLATKIKAAKGWKFGLGAQGINDAGYIVGIGTFEGEQHGYLLIPN